MKIARSISGFLILICLWSLLSYATDNPAIPGTGEIGRSFCKLLISKPFFSNMVSSVATVSAGIGIAFVLGFGIGMFIHRLKVFREITMPVLESIRGVAALTLFPLLIVVFGIGMVSRIFVIFWTAWPAVLISTVSSLDMVDSDIVNAARIDCRNGWQIITFIRLPLAAYGIMTGARIGISGGWIGLIAAEMLGATKGLGYFLLWSTQSFRFPEVYATIIVIAGIGGLMNLAVGGLQKHFII